MIEWKKEMVLYHGSYCSVKKPDLLKCRPSKDFGRGFYVTTSREQATHFVALALRKAKSFGFIDKDIQYGFVTSYLFTPSANLLIKEFRDADAEWLHCIASNRKHEFFNNVSTELQAYDIIIGKIANDQTNATLFAYLSGLYGEVGSIEADNDCIRHLLPDKLENQICLRTQKAIDLLTYEGEEKIWML